MECETGSRRRARRRRRKRRGRRRRSVTTRRNDPSLGLPWEIVELRCSWTVEHPAAHKRWETDPQCHTTGCWPSFGPCLSCWTLSNRGRADTWADECNIMATGTCVMMGISYYLPDCWHRLQQRGLRHKVLFEWGSRCGSSGSYYKGIVVSFLTWSSGLVFIALDCVGNVPMSWAVLRDRAALGQMVLSPPLLGNESYFIAMAYFHNYTGSYL